MQAFFPFPSAGIALDYYPTEMSASLLIPKSPRLWHLLYGLVILSSSANLILPVFVVKHMNGFLCYQSSSVPIPADPISNCLWAPSHLVILTDLWNSPASCFSPGFFCVFFFLIFFILQWCSPVCCWSFRVGLWAFGSQSQAAIFEQTALFDNLNLF